MNIPDNEDGALMLAALAVMLFFSVWVLSAIALASTEKKLSSYMFQAQQAQEAADAGVEWAIEEIWHRGLPAVFEEEVAISDDIKARIKVTEKESAADFLPFGGEDNSEDHREGEREKCRYYLSSTAVYKQAKRILKVRVLYTYDAGSPELYESAVIEYYRWETGI